VGINKMPELFDRLLPMGRNSHAYRARLDANTNVSDPAGLLEVDKWAVSRVVLELVKVVGYHPYPFDELSLMATAYAYHRPNVVIDIGTHFGKSARIWFELSRLLQQPTAIHTIDILDPTHPEYPGRKHATFIRGTTVIQHIGDGYVCAQDIIIKNPSSSYLIFLDGDHDYKTVQRELQLARMVRTGCVLAHDTFYQPDSTYNHGPYFAIKDFVDAFPCEQVIHLQTGLPGMSYLCIDDCACSASVLEQSKIG